MNDLLTVIYQCIHYCCINIQGDIPRVNFTKLFLSQIKKIFTSNYQKKEINKSLDQLSNVYGGLIPSLSSISNYYNGYSKLNTNSAETKDDVNESLVELYRDTWFYLDIIHLVNPNCKWGGHLWNELDIFASNTPILIDISINTQDLETKLACNSILSQTKNDNNEMIMKEAASKIFRDLSNEINTLSYYSLVYLLTMYFFIISYYIIIL